jgi:hypothetical protein
MASKIRLVPSEGLATVSLYSSSETSESLLPV